jgi:DNA-directed RNA polymerase specialized sigma24 family protein
MDGAAEAEFSEFMHGRWLELVRLGYVLTGDRGLAEDLAQTALARILPGRKSAGRGTRMPMCGG